MQRSTAALKRRIRSRFPDRGLWEVCGELTALVAEVTAGGGISRRRVRLARVLSRFTAVAIVVFVRGAIILAAADIWSTPGALPPPDWLPLIETLTSDMARKVWQKIAIIQAQES